MTWLALSGSNYSSIVGDVTRFFAVVFTEKSLQNVWSNTGKRKRTIGSWPAERTDFTAFIDFGCISRNGWFTFSQYAIHGA
jgi:hypothetical protein